VSELQAAAPRESPLVPFVRVSSVEVSRVWPFGFLFEAAFRAWPSGFGFLFEAAASHQESAAPASYCSGSNYSFWKA